MALAQGDACTAGEDGDALVVALVQAHGERAMRIARRFTTSADDAVEAYGRAMVQLVRHRARLRPATAHAWWFEVVRREARTVTDQRRRLVPVDDDVLARLTDARATAAPSAEERVLDMNAALHAAEAVGALKADEARALTLQAAGLSYAEIAARLRWTHTKTNRALTEGRRSFRRHFADLESGAACARWTPVIAGERRATPAERARLTVHLRHCGACRSSARAVAAAPRMLALVLPVALAGAAPSGRRPVEGVVRWAEAAWAGVADRATGAALKLQGLTEAASVAKVAAVAASAAAVAGGGVAASQADRDAPAPASGRPVAERAAAARSPHDPPVVPRTRASAPRVPSPSRRAASPRAAPRRREFGHGGAGAAAGEFAAARRSVPAPPSSFEVQAPRRGAPSEFVRGPRSSGGEFGG